MKQLTRYVPTVEIESQADCVKVNESIFAKFAKSYSELKLVKHEKKIAGLDSQEGRRIDVLGWMI